MLIPLLGFGLLRLTNDAERMGRHRNGWFTNAVIGFLIALSLYFAARGGLELRRRL